MAAPSPSDHSEHHDITGSISNALFMESDLRWTRNATSYVADLTANRLPALSRLSSIQTLHEGEQVLYGGPSEFAGQVLGVVDEGHAGRRSTVHGLPWPACAAVVLCD